MTGRDQRPGRYGSSRHCRGSTDGKVAAYGRPVRLALTLATLVCLGMNAAAVWYRARGEIQGHLFLTRDAHEDPDFSYLSAALGYKRMF
jgi:hypothetical protein